MNQIAIVAIFFSTLSLSCNTRPTAPASNSNSEKISFSFYDISSSGTFSGLSSAVPENASSAADTADTAQRTEIGRAETITLTGDDTPLKIDRKIVRNAEFRIETAKPEETQQKIVAIAEASGGFVVESQQSMSDLRMASRDTVAIAIRVAGEKFAGSLEAVRNTGDRIISENIKGEDVTEEFIDIEARLRAKKALEQQFMEIMKRANTVEDALSVQSQLADVRGEIEKIEGRKRFLENQSSMSTIRIHLQTPAALRASSETFTYRLSDSFARGFDVALNFVLGLVTILIAILPFTVFVGLPAFLVFRYFWRKQSGPKSVRQIAEEEINIT